VLEGIGHALDITIDAKATQKISLSNVHRAVMLDDIYITELPMVLTHLAHLFEADSLSSLTTVINARVKLTGKLRYTCRMHACVVASALTLSVFDAMHRFYLHIRAV
jgi:hypothetical protein